MWSLHQLTEMTLMMGANHFAEVIHQIRYHAPDTTIEVLTPDFCVKMGQLKLWLLPNPMFIITI